MNYLGLLFCVFLIEITTAQIMSYVPRNTIPSNIVTNQAQNILANLNGARPAANLGMSVARNMPNAITAMPIPANGASLPVMNSMNTQIANTKITNDQIANIQLANALNTNSIIAEQEVAAINNINIANALNENLVAFAGNMANINGNIATFNLGNAFTVTSGSPGNQAFGIQLLAEALEVGGKVAVNGQIPIFGTVALNGNLPTDGSASVSYSCGRPPAVIATNI